jgi:hypothetical protein
VNDQLTFIGIRNTALEEAASLVRDLAGETFVGIGGNMSLRRPSQAQLADAILALRDSGPPERAGMVASVTDDKETRAQRALAGLRDALKAGITRSDGEHRILLSDGTFFSGRAADEWLALMEAIIQVADNVLGQEQPQWRAYPGASWPDEPVEADCIGSFESIHEAKYACENTRRGGFDDFVIHERTREMWRRKVGGPWEHIDPTRSGSA